MICLFRWGRTLALVFVILYFIAQENILYLLTDDRQIIAAAGDYIIWTIILPLSGYSAYLWDGIYVGATASRTIRNAWYSPFSVFLSPLTLSVSSIWAIMRSGWHWSCSCSHVVFPARRSGKKHLHSSGVKRERLRRGPISPSPRSWLLGRASGQAGRHQVHLRSPVHVKSGRLREPFWPVRLSGRSRFREPEQ